MHEIETAMLTDGIASILSTSFKGSDGSADDGRTGFCQFGGDEGDTLDIFVAVGPAESEFGT